MRRDSLESEEGGGSAASALAISRLDQSTNRLVTALWQARVAGIGDLAPFVYTLWRDGQGPSITDDRLPSLREQWRFAAIAADMRLYTTEMILAVLADTGVRAVALKGPCLSAMALGDPGLRISRDVDVLIHPGQAREAIAALAHLGFDFGPVQYRASQEMHLQSRELGTLDLHVDLAPRWFPVRGLVGWLLEQAAPVHVDGHRILAPGFVGQALVALVGLVKDLPRRTDAKSLVSFAAIAARLDPRETAELEQLARRFGLDRILRIARTLSAELGCALPTATAPADLPDEVLALCRDGLLREEEGEEVSQDRVAATHRLLRERRSDRVTSRLWSTASPVLPFIQDRTRGMASADYLMRVGAGRSLVPGAVKLRYLARHWGVAAHLGHHVFGDEALAFDERTQQVHRLNAAAVFVMDAMGAGRSPRETVDGYADLRGIGQGEALREVVALVRWWAGLGWTIGAPPRPSDAPTKVSREPPAPTADDGRGRLCQDARFCGLTCSIAFEAEEQRRICDDILVMIGSTPAEAAPDLAVRVQSADRGYAILCNGIERGFAISLEALPDALWAAMVGEVWRQPQHFLWIHGALLAQGENTLLMPAAPGSGKTTLSVAAAQAGMAYLTDETTFMGTDFRAFGIPSAPCVKEPGWAVTGALDPGLHAVRALRRRDGRLVKYLTDPYLAAAREPVRPRRITHVVFPRFDAEGEDRLARLEPLEAFEQLFGECISMAKPLRRSDFDQLAAFLEGTSFHTLHYRSTAFALASLDELCASP